MVFETTVFLHLSWLFFMFRTSGNDGMIFLKRYYVIYTLNGMDFLHHNAQVSHGMDITDSNFNL